MKKIIYSFVIMIAAGSLFTSCVTNTEPQGVKDLREAKADYLASLSKLREADAELVKAQAATEQARAEVQKAFAAQNQALAEALQIANEAARTNNEVAAAQAQAKIDSIKAASEKAAVVAEQALAQAQWDLEVALRRIAAQSMTTTAAEDSVIRAAADSLLSAQKAYNKEVKDLNNLKQQLWIAQYDHAAGYDTLSEAATQTELLKNYQDSVADREGKIDTYKANIETYEAVKENPQAAQDFIDAYTASNKEAQRDSLNAWTAQNLYEVTTLVEANRAYKEKVEAFKKDSVGKPVDYCFTKDTEKKTAVKYPLTNGKGLDALFASYINGNIKVEGLSAASKGISVDGDAKNILVGGKDVKGRKDLDTAQAIVATIVEALNRELVVVNDSIEAKEYEGLVEDAKIKDSVYTAHRAILEAGLEEYAPYKDSVAKIDTLKEAKKVARVKDSIAGAKVAADEVAIKDAVKDVAADYIAANKAFVSAVNDIVTGGGIGNISITDSAAFIKAVQNLGKAQAAYHGYTDSLVLYAFKDEDVAATKVSIADLQKEGFVETKADDYASTHKVTSLYGGTGYGKFAKSNLSDLKAKAWYSDVTGTDYKVKNNTFSRITAVILNREEAGYAFLASISEDNVALPLKNIKTGENADYAYDNESKMAYKYNHTLSQDDTVLFAKKYTVAADAEIAALAEDLKVKDTTATVLDNATTALTNYKGVEKAESEYIQIYKSFWGMTADQEFSHDDTLACEKPQIFAWNEETFNNDDVKCLIFKADGKGVVNNNTICIVLDRIDPENGPFVGPNSKYPEASKILYREGNTNQPTEFSKAVYAQQLAEAAADYEFLEDQLANINEQVAAIAADVKAYNEKFDAANKAYTDGMKALTGGKAEVTTLAYANVDGAKGVWDLKGKQLEFANEVAPEYPELVKAFLDCKKKAEETIAENNNVIDKLNKVCEAWAKLESNDSRFNKTTADDIIKELDKAIKEQNDNIKTAKQEIDAFKKAIAMAEQGYDSYTIEIETLNNLIALAEQRVAFAEEVLKIRKAEYEAVIAKYGVRE